LSILEEFLSMELIEFLFKPRRLPFDKSDDFIILKTQINDVEVLIDTLRELGLSVQVNYKVRGYYESKNANVVAVLKGDCDIGWIENTSNSDGTFDLIVDLWGVGKYYEPESLIASINQKYYELKAIKDGLS
jgi:hypothetical protein